MNIRNSDSENGLLRTGSSSSLMNMVEGICLCQKYFWAWYLGGDPRHPPPSMEVEGESILFSLNETMLIAIIEYLSVMNT